MVFWWEFADINAILGLLGQKAFMSGKLKIRGQMMLATKLDTVFKQLAPAKAKL
jgi:SCP-2 sterol transfer family